MRRPTFPSPIDDSVPRLLALLLALASVPAVAAVGLLGGEAVYPSPLGLLALNVVFLGLIPLHIAYVSFGSFRRGGRVSILLMGTGMLCIGLGAIAAGTVGLLPAPSNLVITVHNTTVCTGAALQAAAALVALVGWWVGPAERRRTMAVSAYALIVAAVTALVATVLSGLTPIFFVPGAGPTELRMLVLLGAIALFAVAAVLFLVLYRRRAEEFFLWYALGLGLTAIGLVAVSFYSTFDDLLSWAGRAEQYLGACYLLAAFLILQRRAASGHVAARDVLASFFAEAEAGYRDLLETAGDAIIVLGPDDRVLLWNAAAERLFGRARAEAVGMPFSNLVPHAPRPADDGGGLPVRRDLEVRRPDGTTVPVDLVASRRMVEGRPVTTCILHDLSERKRSEAALRESEARLVEAQRLAKVGDWEWNLATDDVIWSRETNAIFGRNPDLPAPSFWQEQSRYYTPESWARLNEAVQGAVEAGKPYDIEIEVVREDGDHCWLIARGEAVRDADGAVAELHGTVQDITERRKADEALRVSEAKYRTLYTSIDQGYFVIDVLFDEYDRPVDLFYAEANDAAVQMLGQDWTGKWLTEISPDYEPYWFETFGEVVRTGKSIRLERYAAPDRRWYDFYVFRIGGPESRRIGNTFLDITERKRAEEALAGVNRILSAALTSKSEEALGEVCLAVAEEITQSRFGFIGEVTETGLEDIAISNPGWDACAAITPAGHRRPPGNFALRGLFGRVLTEGRSLIANDPATHPGRAGTPAGHPPLTAFLGVPLLRDGAVTGMIGVANRTGGYTEAEQQLLEAVAPAITDAFERFRAAQNLQRYAADLERSNEDLERFAYVSSHDLQEPLRSIVSFSQLLERRYRGKLDADADEYIGFIVEGGTRMQTLIQDLLAYSRVNSKAQELRPTDMEAVMAAIERNLDLQLREVGAIVTYDPLPTVMADPLQLEQVLSNLISNATKFRTLGEPLRIHIGARRLDGFWEFSVRDNGIGIEPEYFDQIFVIFQRLHTKDAYPGTGIGLAIVKRIIDRHGGRIRVESTPGEGSTFFFTLPAA